MGNLGTHPDGYSDVEYTNEVEPDVYNEQDITYNLIHKNLTRYLHLGPTRFKNGSNMGRCT